MQCRLLTSQNQLIQQDNESNEHSVDSPMQIRLINFLGLRQYLMDKLIFKRNLSTYRISKQHNGVKLFMPKQYRPPLKYQMEMGILQHGKHSIPFVKLIPGRSKSTHFDTVVYAHGNSSDMSDGVRFMERMALIYQAEYVVFDYNGYGQSRNTQVGEQTICRDLEIVLAYLNKPLNRIVLWGFSLGTYPVLYVAARYFIKGVVLQCPIGSVGCFFRENLFTQIKFKEDYFANINLISRVKGKIFLMHSSSDQIIPISHAQLLYEKFIATNGVQRIFFIEVMKLTHNGLHRYIASKKSNDLQKQLVSFLTQLRDSQGLGQVQVNGKLSQLSEKIRLAPIHHGGFSEDSYEIMGNLRDGLGTEKKWPKFNCFCLSQQPPLQSGRQKFRAKR